MSSEPADAERLRRRLEAAWSPATSSKWTGANPARGQCSVTALAVQRLCGGEILKTDTPEGPHFYNRIGGVRLDFTVAQFDRPISYQDLPSNVSEAMADTAPEQLSALLGALERDGG